MYEMFHSVGSVVVRKKKTVINTVRISSEIGWHPTGDSLRKLGPET